MSDQAPAAAGPQLNGATKKAGDGSSLITAASILGGLVIWEVAARYVVGNPLFLSAPTQIAAEIGKLLGTGELQMHMAVSGLEFIIGLAISIVLGVGMGFLIATNRVANKIIGPWVALLNARRRAGRLTAVRMSLAIRQFHLPRRASSPWQSASASRAV